MAYTTINKSTEHFNTKLWSGNATDDRAISGLDFAPNWVWIKNRTDTNSYALFDTVRGATKYIESDTTDAEATGATFLKSFTSDGFTLGTAGRVNANSQNYVSWNWKANGAGSANTDGSISSTVSANTTSGFSVGTYSGNSTTGATVGHNLGVAPSMVIVKKTNNVGDWYCYHSGIGATKFIKLNDTAASATNALWNNTAPTSSVFSMDNNSAVNGSGDSYVFYAFAEKQGYSKVGGSYTGNGNADGTFVYTGFKPAFVMFKQTNTSGGQWYIYDNKRGQNELDKHLYPNLSSAEATGDNAIDILSNGFKMRSSNGDSNASGSTYIYMAFAEAPLVGTNNVPCTAR